MLRIRRTHIIEQVIRAPDDLGKMIHYLLHFFWTDGIERTHCLAGLEIYIRVLRRTAQNWMVRGKRPLTVFKNAIHVDECPQIVFAEHLDLVDLMRGAEPIKEMQKRDTGFESRCMRNQRHVHGLLDRVGAEHREPRSSARHHIRMIAKN